MKRLWENAFIANMNPAVILKRGDGGDGGDGGDVSENALIHII